MGNSFIPAGWPVEYHLWNSAISRFIRLRSKPGIPFYLNADDEVLTAIGANCPLGSEKDPIAALIEAIVPTLVTTDPKHLFDRHSMSFDWYRSFKRDTTICDDPPFLPLLLASVVAAERMKSDGKYSSGNYYVRLAQIVGVADRDKNEVGDAYRRSVAKFWNYFNEWLIDAGFAQPTAYPVGPHEYVGVPIGQALIRDHERKQIEEQFFNTQFNRAGLKEVLEPSELNEEFRDWIFKQHGLPNLRYLFQVTPETINALVAQLYEQWVPGTTDDSSDTAAKLRVKIVAKRSSLGRAFISQLSYIFASAFGPKSWTEIAFTLGEDKFESGICSDYAIENGIRLNFDCDSKISKMLALRADLRCIAGSQKFRAERRPRGVVPLEPFGPGVWIETGRMLIGNEYRLLVHQEIKNQVDDAIKLVAQFASAANCSGLPNDWFLYDPFIVQRHETSQILPIQVSETPQIRLIRGTQIPRNGGIPEYVNTDLPTVVAFPLPKVSGLIRVLTTSENEPIPDLIVNPEQLQMDLVGLARGTYEAILIGGTKEKRLSVRSFQVVDPEFPRVIPRGSGNEIGISVSQSGGFVSGTAGLDGSTFLRGAHLVSGQLKPVTDRTFQSSRLLSETPDDDALDLEEEYIAPSDIGSNVVQLPNCVLDPTKPHYQVLETFYGKRKRNVYWYCKRDGCSATGVEDGRIKIRKFLKSAARTQSHSESEWIARVLSSPPPGIDSKILDALFALGGGSEREYSVLASLDSFGDPRQVLWKLAAMGHVDVEEMEHDLIGSRWNSNPPTFTETAGRFRLVGHRSARLIEELSEEVYKIGGRIEILANSEINPTGDFVVHALQLGQMVEICSGLKNRDDLMVSSLLRVDSRVSTTLLDALPRWSDVLNSSSNAEIEIGPNDSMFDFENRQWLQINNSIIKNHAIRFGRTDRSERKYGFVLDGDVVSARVYLCGYRMAKHLAARLSGRTLLSFDSNRSLLQMPLGADLPLLITRALVYRTGIAPVRLGGRIVFQGVTDAHYSKLLQVMDG